MPRPEKRSVRIPQMPGARGAGVLSKRRQYRHRLHIALMTPEQLLPDLEDCQEAQQARGYPASRESSNTVILIGPGKAATIASKARRLRIRCVS